MKRKKPSIDPQLMSALLEGVDPKTVFEPDGWTGSEVGRIGFGKGFPGAAPTGGCGRRRFCLRHHPARRPAVSLRFGERMLALPFSALWEA